MTPSNDQFSMFNGIIPLTKHGEPIAATRCQTGMVSHGRYTTNSLNGFPTASANATTVESRGS
jgi:hypothetical protein